MHIRNNALFLALLIALCEHPCLVHAQNTFTPDPIQHYYPSFWNDDVFAERVPAFALGHQWGAAKLDKVNTAFKMNVTSQNWGYLNAFAHEMYKLGRGSEVRENERQATNPRKVSASRPSWLLHTVRIETTAPTHAMPIVQRVAVVR